MRRLLASDAATGGSAAVDGELGRLGVPRSVTVSLAGKSVELVTLLLLATVVPRALGPADYGHFAVPLTIVTVGSLALTLGGPTTLARFVPAAAPGARRAVAVRLGGRLARGRAGQLLAIAAVTALAVAVDPTRVPPATAALVVLALALNVAATLALQVGLGLGRTGWWSARFPIQNAVLVVAVLVLHRAAGNAGALLAIVLSGAVAAAIGAAVVRPLVTDPPREDVDVPAGAIRFGVLHATGAGCTQLAHRGAVIVVAVLAGSRIEAGYTALALGVALGVTYAVLQAFTVSLPHLAGDPPAAETTLRRLAGGIVAVLVPVALVTAALLDRAVPAVFGGEYDRAVTTFGPAVAMVVLAPLNALAVQVAALRLRPEAATAAGVAGLVAFAVVAVTGVPAWDAVGGTTAALAAVAVSGIVSLVMLPDAIGARLAAVSFGGAAAVLVVAVVAS
jgi:O-antigen/teichoic acid export membrane protein